MFSAAKDALTAAAARKFIGGRLARYGSLRDFQIDSRERTLRIVCDLAGEPGPIEVHVGRYEIEEDGGKYFVRPTRCTCSRPWISHLLEDFVEGRRFELPAWGRAAL